MDIITLGKSFHCLRLYLWLDNMALTCLGCLINTCSTKVQKEIHPEEYLELSEELKIYNTTGLHGEFGKKNPALSLKHLRAALFPICSMEVTEDDRKTEHYVAPLGKYLQILLNDQCFPKQLKKTQ